MTHFLRNEKHGWLQDLSVLRHPSQKVRGASPAPVSRRSRVQSSRIETGHGVVLCTHIRSHGDIIEARKQGRELAAKLGFSSIDCTLVATAISELSRNILLHAVQGEIRLSRERCPGFTGITITASDKGPGIRDLRNALQESDSTSRGLGLGLPGVRRIMDEFDVDSKLRQGTTVTVKKWKAI